MEYYPGGTMKEADFFNSENALRPDIYVFASLTNLNWTLVPG
jgi:hypothetical protein